MSFMPDPKPGMPATVCGWANRYPATVIYANGDFVAVRLCHAKRLTGVTEDSPATPMWDFQEDPSAFVYWFRMGDSGKYVEYEMDGSSGTFRKIKDGNGLILGYRGKYQDSSF